jgi:hypothetical protein
MEITTLDIISPIKIVLQTQEEVDQLYTLLNYIPIMAALEDDDGWLLVREVLMKQKSNDYLKWHEKLSRVLERSFTNEGLL